MKEDRDISIKINERTLQERSDFIRKSKIRIMALPKREDSKKDTDSLLK